MELYLKKQPVKYLTSVDALTRNKLYRALDKLKELDGDIKKLQGYENLYRFKISHYRILFSISEEQITIEAIGPRGDVYK